MGLDEATGEVPAMARSDLCRSRRQGQVRVLVAMLTRPPFLLRQLHDRVAISLVEVNVAALLGEDVRLLEELVQVRVRSTWCLLHDHLSLLILKERSNGHISVLNLILDIGEALISQL